MAVDKAIVVQTAGKIAADLVSSMQLRTTGDVMDSFNEVFGRVFDAMNVKINEADKKTKGGRQIPIISQDSIKARLDESLRAGTTVTSNSFNA